MNQKIDKKKLENLSHDIKNTTAQIKQVISSSIPAPAAADAPSVVPRPAAAAVPPPEESKEDDITRFNRM